MKHALLWLVVWLQAGLAYSLPPSFPPLLLSPVAVTVTTTVLTGLGTFSLKIPGTFSGTSSQVNQRYLARVEVSADAVAVGDYIDNLSIRDDDGVIPAPLRSQFPDYPVVLDFGVDSGVGTIAGYYIQGGSLTIAPISGDPFPIPSGLYLKATIHNAGLLSKAYRFNVIWGRVPS